MKSNAYEMGPMRKLFGIFLAVGLTLSLLFTLAGFIADRYLLRPEPYVEALDRYNFPELFPRLLAEMIVNKEPPSDPQIDPPGEITGPANQIKYLNADDYELILNGLIPPDWVEENTGLVFRQLFAFLNLETGRLQLVVPLANIKTGLAGEMGNTITQRLIHSWPPCTVEWLMEVTVNGLTGNLEGFPTCQPPDDFFPLVEPLVRSGLDELAGTMPEQVDLVQIAALVQAGAFRFDQIPPAQEGSGPRLPVSFQVFRWLVRLSPLLSIWSLVMLSLVMVRGWRSILIWWGVPLLAAGIIGMALSLLAGLPLYSYYSQRAADRSAEALSENMVQLLAVAVESVVQRYFLWVGIGAIIFTLAGAGMLVAAAILEKNLPEFRK